MLSYFFIYFFRSLLKHKGYSLLNIGGLTVAFTACLLVFVYLRHEFSYDKFHEDADHIYRIAWFSDNPQTRTPHPMAQGLVNEFPEVLEAVSLSPLYGPNLTIQAITLKNPENNIIFEEPNGYQVDSTFFDVFSFEFIIGNKEALREPGGIIITSSVAEKYFGTDNPLGKRLLFSSREYPLEVVGVVADVPDNSHFHFNFLISYVSTKSLNPDNPWFQWGDFGHFNYVKLNPGADPIILNDKMLDWVAAKIGWPTENLGDFRANQWGFKLQPITDIHLYSHIRWELEANGNIVYIYIVSIAAVLILVIAATNYVNLTTARSAEWTKSIGVQKAMGAVRSQIAAQFFGDALATSLLSWVLALPLASGSLPFFNNLTQRSFQVTGLYSADAVIITLLIALCIGILAGWYPAIVLAGVSTTGALKPGYSRSFSGGSSVRRFLVIFQFALSACLIFSAILIFQQTQYMQSRPLGFDHENLLSVTIQSEEVTNRLDALKTELNQIPGVMSVGAASNVPGGQFNQNPVNPVDQPENGTGILEMRTDFEALDVLGVSFVAGRNFDRSFVLDSAGVSFVINETAADYLQLEEPIGSRLFWDDDLQQRTGTVIGVVKNFHIKSLHQEVEPLIVHVHPSVLNYLLVRVSPDELETTIGSIKRVYEQFDPQFTFEYTFLDDQLNDLYHAEKRTLQVFGLFSFVAIVLACLGLAGLATYMLHRRTKEIGVRKVVGASAFTIWKMINFEFVKLIMISLLLGMPLAYWFMQNWLQNFTYQMPISAAPFLYTALISVAIALLSVSYLVLKISLSNPVRSLRYE